MTANGFDPISVMAEVERGATRIEQTADTLAEAIRAASEAEAAYEGAFEAALLRIYHEHRSARERPPAEDIRRALAHEQVDDGLYAAHLMAKANLAAADKLLKGLSAAVSARQSLLRTAS